MELKGCWKLLLLLVCLIACFLAGVDSKQNTSKQASKSVPKLSSQEMAGLQVLWRAWKNNTPNLALNLENWGSTSDPCSNTLGWEGIECRYTEITKPEIMENTLSSLDLYNIGIVGDLPSEISLFSNIEDLDLSNNKFTSPLPNLSTLINLDSLDLSNNKFTSRLPNFSTLINLDSLDLSYNKFTSRLPNFSTLINLEYLDLSNNKFTSPLPNFSTLINLYSLDLSNNKFMGPLPNFITLVNLGNLNFSNNKFRDSIPNFTTLVNLSIWDLSNNKLTGPLPNFTTLVNLSQLNFSKNKLTGPLPDFITSINLWSLDLSNNKFTGPLPNFTTLVDLVYLDLSNNKFMGPLPNFTTLVNLYYLDLSNNKLTGLLPKVTSLVNLQQLDLSNNKFTGPLPNLKTLVNLEILNLSLNFFTGLSNNLSTFLTTLPKMLSKLYLDKNNITGTLDIPRLIDIVSNNITKSLKVLNLKNNMITNVVTPKFFINGRTIGIFLQGNPYCNNIWASQEESTWCSIYCEQQCIYLPKSNNNWKIIVTSSSISFAIILMLVVMGFVFVLHGSQKHIHHLKKQIKKADINTKWFTYSELRVATNNFALEMKLGAGAYGTVYKGVLENNVVVAIKKLFLETNKGKDDFLNEIILISNLQHRNLVTLKGYCLHGKQMLLVYEYIDNCDLDNLLFSRNNPNINNSSNCNQQVLSWQTRLNVCQGVAEGLNYLHASCQSRIIHRDIKASNILLNKNFHPKIADFGLARPIEDAQSVILTQQCAGTFGYLAPEYVYYGQLSDKADVFSFGVLLFEIVSGKRNRDLTMPEDEVYLPTRAWKLYKENRLLDIKDTTLLVTDDEVVEVQRALEIGLMCVQSIPEKRPSMFLVVGMLAGKVSVNVLDIAELDCEYSLFLSSISAPPSGSRENPLTKNIPTIS